MGKFFEALKKSESATRTVAQEHRPKRENVVDIPSEKIDMLKMDTAPKPTHSEKDDPVSGRAIDPYLVALSDPTSSEAESFKVLRAKLFVGTSFKTLRTIMVSSAEPLDGKTLVAANLAVTIARGVNEHVMLADCDLRRPSLHQRFGLPLGAGIREYLESGTALASYMIKTSQDKLTLLLAGQSPPNPSELLSSEKMRLLVEELKNRYDDRYIILDAPPAQFTAETNFLASMVDGILLVVRYGKTSKNLIAQAIDNLGREKILGVVFNASNEHSRKYGYYYKYYQKHPVGN